MDGTLGYQRTPDHEHLRIAARQGHAVVAENYKDVERLTDQIMERGLPHAGVIMIRSGTMTLAGWLSRPSTSTVSIPNGLPPHTVV